MRSATTRSWPKTSEDLRERVVSRLSRLTDLSEESARLLGQLGPRQIHPPSTELIAERETTGCPRFIVSGWAARVKILPDGRRQILTFLIPGDAVGLCLRPHPLALGSTIALTAVETVDASAVQTAITTSDPRWRDLAEAMHASSSLHEAYLLDQVMRLGRLTAYERMCHMLLELRDRMGLVGQGSEQRFPLPLTQEMLADATGLSIVHVNRVLQQLRREGILDLRGGVATLRNPEAMADLCDYHAPEPSDWRRPPPR